jgi:glycosyltransferase involved in cell wall biosynthesis
MPSLHTLGFLGNYAPRRCGIATFTQDLRAAIGEVRPKWQMPVAMVSDDADGYAYPKEVEWILPQEQHQADYRKIARSINESGVGAVSLQHEYGIFGGECGRWVVDLLESLEVPVVTTCHTVLKDPSPMQREVLRRIARLSSSIVVMAEKGREFLHEVYDVPDRKIAVIPHGIPDIQVTPEATRALCRRQGWQHRRVLLTFGLLSPNKGIENAIRALPEIVRSHPDLLYVVVGATHPNLVREQGGDVYRQELTRLVSELGMEAHVEFIDRFVMREELVSYIAAADIYCTPYLNEAQITSGTLAYAFGLGKPVISTPYWHASELLANGAGVLVPFSDSAALAQSASDLLADDERRQAMAALARTKGLSMSWRNVGQQYAKLIEETVAQSERRIPIASAASFMNFEGGRPALGTGSLI